MQLTVTEPNLWVTWAICSKASTCRNILLYCLSTYIGEETFFIHVYNDICIEVLNVGAKVLKVNDIVIEKDDSKIVELSYNDHDDS